MKVAKCPDCGELIELLDNILEWDEETFRRHHHHHHHWAKTLAFSVTSKQVTAKGVNMTYTLTIGSAPASGLVSAVLADGVTPATAVLTALTISNSDDTIVTVVPDPSNPLGVIATAVAAGSSVLTGSATATETDGTVHQISGAVTLIVAPAAVGQAAALVFSFGLPVSARRF